MSATKSCRERISPRSNPFLAPILLTMVTALAVIPSSAEEPVNSVLIGYLVASDAPVDSVETVRISFEVLNQNAPAEQYTLQIFDFKPEASPTETTLLVEQTVVVDGLDPLEPGEIWIDEPPVPMKWVQVELVDSLAANSGSLLYAIEFQPDQLPVQTGVLPGVLPHLEKECDEPRTFFSTDGGLTWHQLTAAALECLPATTCEDNGSTNLRINVRPC